MAAKFRADRLGPSRLELDKPVIAAIEGPAVAGGMELGLWCDFRVMAQESYFGVYCRRWGVPLIDGGTVRLPRIVGQGRALEIILTGRKVPAEECLDIGLCEYVTPKGGARQKAEELAQEIARFPQVCVARRPPFGHQKPRAQRACGTNPGMVQWARGADRGRRCGRHPLQGWSWPSRRFRKNSLNPLTKASAVAAEDFADTAAPRFQAASSNIGHAQAIFAKPYG